MGCWLVLGCAMVSSNRRKVILAQDLFFRYKGQSALALDSFSLDLYEREVLCVLGHNGAGKTTLLNLIYGTLRPRCGRALINQEVIRSYRDIFYLDSRFALNEDMSVADNIEFRIELLGGEASGAAAQLELFSLWGYESAPVRFLSTGLRQRASLAVGFSVGPSLALLDEPTNAVDPETRLLLENLLRGRGLDRCSALVVTHDLDFAYNVADRCVVMQDGKELAQRRPAEYPSSQDFQSEYLSLTSGRGKANASHHY